MLEAAITTTDGVGLDDVFAVAAGFVALVAAIKIVLNAISKQAAW